MDTDPKLVLQLQAAGVHLEVWTCGAAFVVCERGMPMCGLYKRTLTEAFDALMDWSDRLVLEACAEDYNTNPFA